MTKVYIPYENPFTSDNQEKPGVRDRMEEAMKNAVGFRSAEGEVILVEDMFECDGFTWRKDLDGYERPIIQYNDGRDPNRSKIMHLWGSSIIIDRL